MTALDAAHPITADDVAAATGVPPEFLSDPIRDRIRREAAEYLATCDSLERCEFDRHRIVLDGVSSCPSCGLGLWDYRELVPMTWPAHR